MNRFIPRIIAMALCLCGCVTVSCAQDWKQLLNEHSIVYFIRDEEFARQMSQIRQSLIIGRLPMILGYSRYSDFWTWENRVKIYIYPDRESYAKVSNMPGWSEGMADYTHRQIICYERHEGFIDGLLPHEMTHLIFRDFVGFKGEVPLWLDEGVAQWEEPFKRERVRQVSKYLLTKGMLVFRD